MEKDFITYTKRPGDTLKSLSFRLGMTGDELKAFHNAHCGKMKRIWFEDLHEIDSILVPIHIENKTQENRKREIGLLHTYFPKTFYTGEYVAVERFENASHDSFTIKYSITVDVQAKDKQTYVVEIHRKNFEKNGDISNDKISSLSLACMEAISPISFLMSEGEIKGFHGHNDRILRFENERLNLEEVFIGDISRNYIQKFKENISDEAGFLQKMQSTLFFQTLFPKTHWFSNKNSWTESFYPLQNSLPQKYRLNMERNIEDQDFTETIIKGHIQEEPEQIFTGEIVLKYQTDKTTNSLRHAEASTLLLHKGELFKKHHLTLTQK